MPDPISAILSDPAILASLQNTLTHSGVLTQYQAAQDQIQKDAAARTTAATQEAGQASQQYQTAAAQPPPQLDPLSASLPLLLGNIASVIAKDPSFAGQAQADLGERRKSLMESRTQNLTALRDNYLRKADAAEKAGDTEAATKARAQTESLSKTLDVLLEQQHHTTAMEVADKQGKQAADLQTLRGKQELEQISATGAENRKTELVKQQAAEQAANQGYFDQAVTDAPGGGKFFDMGQIPNNFKVQGAARKYAKDAGYKAVDKDTGGNLKKLNEVLAGIDQVEQMTQRILTPTMGLSNVPTALGNLGSLLTKNNVDVNSFGVTKELAIRVLSTLVSGQGSGVRITQPEVNLVNQNWPQLTDPLQVAQGKLAWQRIFLMNKANAALGRPAAPLPNIGAYKKLPAGSQVRSDGKVYVQRKSDNQTGWIRPDDPDFNLYRVARGQ